MDHGHVGNKRTRRPSSRFSTDTLLLDDIETICEPQPERRVSARVAAQPGPYSGGQGLHPQRGGTVSRSSQRSGSEETQGEEFTNAAPPQYPGTMDLDNLPSTSHRPAPRAEQSFTQPRASSEQPGAPAATPTDAQLQAPAADGQQHQLLLPGKTPATGASAGLTAAQQAALAAAEEIEFPAPVQQLLGQILDSLVKEDNNDTRIPMFARNKARKLKSGAHSVVQPLYIGFEEARMRLSVGHFPNIQELYREVESHCQACWLSLEEANQDNPVLSDALRTYLVEMSHQYAQEVIALCEEVAESRMGKGARRVDFGTVELKPTRSVSRRALQEDAMPPLPGAGLNLPASVSQNREPYCQGAWRREPFPPRAYVPISEFAIDACTPDEDELLRVRLRTERADGASEHFRTEHQLELGEQMAALEAKLAKAVRERDVLKQGEDVIEIDAWGIDMYTRRNVFDALVESGIFSNPPPPPVAPPAVTNTVPPLLTDTQHAAQPNTGNGAPEVDKETQPSPHVTAMDVDTETQPGAGAASIVVDHAPAGPGDAKEPDHQGADAAVVADTVAAALASAQSQLAVGEAAAGRDSVPQVTVVADASAVEVVPPPPAEPSCAAVQDAAAEPPADLGPPAEASRSQQGPNTAGGSQSKVADGQSKVPGTPSKGALTAPGAPMSPQMRARMAALDRRGWNHGPDGDKPAPAPQGGTDRQSCGGAVTKTEAEGAAVATVGVSEGGDVSGASPEVAARVHAWIDSVFLPAINHAGLQGFNMQAVCETVRREAAAAGDALSAACADIIEARLRQCGWPYFRIHPKGRGIQCTKKGGIQAFTLVEEYLGEIHSPWRWWEMQDALRKLLGQEDLPDFYNITLERPKDDPAGYDVLYVEAAFKATFASRMSHSCTPNCQAVVVSAGGRLTIAMYSLRDILEGEELTFDYTSVTESEKEFRSAICLCGTQSCRGSYLHFLGAKAFGLVLDTHHTLLHRQAIILRACSEKLTDEDRERLKAHGFGTMALEQATSGAPPCPEWLQKWAALVLEYVELENKLLPGLMVKLPPPFDQYTHEYAQAQAQSVMSSRITSILVALDKIKMCLRQPGQLQCPPLRLLEEEEVMAHLWTGERSVMRRAVTVAAPYLLPAPLLAMLGGLCPPDSVASYEDMHRVLMALNRTPGGGSTSLGTLLAIATQQPENLSEVRKLLLQCEGVLRSCEDGSGMHTAAADVLHLTACITVWFTAERNYKGFNSPPVVVSEDMLKLHKSLVNLSAKLDIGNMGAAASLSRPQPSVDDDAGDDADGDDFNRHQVPGRRKSELTRGEGAAMSKRYGPWFMWSQLSAWYKQTVSDPSASLSAERRGTLCLPDIECCFATRGNARYTPRERMALLDHIERKPDTQWKTSVLWTFKNEAKIYGTPMLDAVYLSAVQGTPSSLPTIVGRLRSTIMSWAGRDTGSGPSNRFSQAKKDGREPGPIK